jgi:methylated-DNA-[protein]-cysteine S-methyltransferase
MNRFDVTDLNAPLFFHQDSPVGLLSIETMEAKETFETWIFGVENGFNVALLGIKFLSEADTQHPSFSPLAPKTTFQIQVNDLLHAYWKGETVDLMSIPIGFKTGTSFQKSCWEAIMTIPYGETRTYEWVTKQINRPNAYRAVGQANRTNPIPLVIPCHRVIGKDDKLTGYMGSGEKGLNTKQFLLDLEAAHKPTPKTPLATRSL